MHQITCTCGCNRAIPDLDLTALEAACRYGGAKSQHFAAFEARYFPARPPALQEFRLAA